MARTEIKFGGFGGQGIILAGFIVGKAVSLYDKKEAVFTQSYGPEARGGACAASLVIDDKVIDYPYPVSPDIMVIMSQEAYHDYVPKLKEGGILIIDEDLVSLDDIAKRAGKIYKIPATRFAEELGMKIAANIVMLGFFGYVARNLLTTESLKKSVLESVPARFRDQNAKAFDKGYKYAQETIKGE
ncbi:MAG: 2-oxoacid:acceptor oxidoreductase family protein [Thermoplasmata archaeon]|nr:2-oxoacid:acceptor oxidoreductase family protein [Thermoplasmata archaeon]